MEFTSCCGNMEPERVLCVKPQVFVYKIPSRSTNKAPKASEWDLTNPNWEGSLKIVEKGKQLRIDLIDKTGALFGSCPIDSHPSTSVEGVSDSSRYFIIKLVNDNGKHAFIGIGFAERNDSFDFNCTIHDFFTKDARLEAMRKEFQKGPAIDLRLKEGQKLNFDISGLVNRNNNPSASKSTTQRVSTKTTKMCTVLMPDEVGDVSNSSTAKRVTTTSKHSSSNLLPSDLFETTSVSNPFDSLNNPIHSFGTNAIATPYSAPPQNDFSNLLMSSPIKNSVQQSNIPLEGIFASSGSAIQQQTSHNLFPSAPPSGATPGIGYMNNSSQTFQPNPVFSSGGVNMNPPLLPSQTVTINSAAEDPFASFAKNELGQFPPQTKTNRVDSDIFNFDSIDKNDQPAKTNNYQDPFF